MGRSAKQEKLFPLPSHLMNHYCLSKKIPIEKEKERKKEKNTDRTQTKLNAPHVMYNVEILSH